MGLGYANNPVVVGGFNILNSFSHSVSWVCCRGEKKRIFGGERPQSLRFFRTSSATPLESRLLVAIEVCVLEQFLVGMSAASAVMFLFSLLALPWFLGKIPADYFVRQRVSHTWKVLLQPHAIVRNVLGLPIVLAGIAMLVLPGQGILTIIVGLGVMQFPGKFEAERWVVRRPGVLQAINWMREKSGHVPLEQP